MRVAPFPLALLALLSVTTGLAAPALDVTRTSTPPKIDGVLDDDVWRTAAHSDAFRQIEPLEDAAPTERTEFWVTFDSANVYIAVRCDDSAGAAGIRAYSMQRDQTNDSDDDVLLAFDTFYRQSDGYFFGLSAAGGLRDGLIQNKNEPTFQWDGLWLGKAHRDATGWSAEFAIPAKSLAFDPANSTWGFNLSRTIRRKQETVRWSGFSRAKKIHSLPDTGELRGLEGLRQGRGLDFKPYASAIRHSAPAPDQKRAEFNPGFDLTWHVTPSLAATLTVNTDFADAEVDDRQINLGRFPLFFPEKRGFFTQDASLFTFSGIFRDPLPFFSRRIGLAADGSKVDLQGGLKLAGRAGPWTVGLLDVQIGEHAGVAAKNLFVGRASLQVLAESSVGVIVTHGDPRTNGENSLVGTDFVYTNSHLPGNRTLAIKTSIQYTDSGRARGQGAAGTFKVVYPNEPLNSSFWFSRLGNHYDPALGFVARIGVAEYFVMNHYRWHVGGPLLRTIDATLDAKQYDDLHGRLQDRNLDYPGVALETVHGDFLNARYQRRDEVLDVPFAIRPRIVIPARRYAWGIPNFEAGTATSRPVDLHVSFIGGGFYGGTQRNYLAELGWRPSPLLALGLSSNLRQVRLPQGNFNLRLGQAKAVYTFSPDLQVSLLAQYDNFSNLVGTNLRVKWIVQPGNEIFFIVNQGYDTSLDRFRPTANDTSLKGAWTVRF